MAKNKTISICYLFRHLLKTKVDYLYLIFKNIFTNFIFNFIFLSLTPLFLLIFKFFIFAIISCKVYLYLLFIAVIFVAVVLSRIFRVFIAAS